MRPTLPLILVALALAPAAVAQPATPKAAERLNAPGPEAQALAARAGTWDVVATMWPAPGAAPMVTRGLVAERRMVGVFLQEDMHPAPGQPGPAFTRIDYQQFSRVEGRWQYVSLDTRMPVGIMPAWSYDRGAGKALVLQFEPIAFVGFGPTVEGRMLRSDLTITRLDADHETKEQRFLLADGEGRPWTAVRYEYTRRK